MLDDTNLVKTYDKSGSVAFAAKQYDQLLQTYDIDLGDISEIQNVVFTGMGGSAISATMPFTWPGLAKPYQVVRDYTIPEYVNQNTLFIASSYSGNTEETLSALELAEQAGAKIAVIAHGGKLGEIAKNKKYPYAELPDSPQPRMATFYSFKALVTILEAASAVKKGAAAELEEAARKLQGSTGVLTADVPTAENKAKQVAQELMGKSIVVYASTQLFPAANKWKISFNENAKNVAWVNQYPEFNHNEFIGWSSHPVEKPYAIIDIVSDLDHPRVQKRFGISAKLLSGKRPHPVTVKAQGDTMLEQLLSTCVLGDFVSFYLAFLNGHDPAPIDLVERMKKELV